MGRKDMAAKALMRRSDAFADAFNTLFRRAGFSVDAGSLVERNPEIVVPAGWRRGVCSDGVPAVVARHVLSRCRL